MSKDAILEPTIQSTDAILAKREQDDDYWYEQQERRVVKDLRERAQAKRYNKQSFNSPFKAQP